MPQSKIERLSHYAVIVIAIVAVVVSFIQLQLSHKHNKLSVKPYFDAHLIQRDSVLTVSFSNEGFGPAIIKNIKFIYQGNAYSSLEKYLEASGEKTNRLGSYNYNKNTIVASGTTKLLVQLKGIHLRGVKVEIDYESMYEEKRIFSFNF